MEKKAVSRKKAVVKKTVKAAPKPAEYFFAVGRRKTAQAKIKLTGGGSGAFTVNQKDAITYFPTVQLQKYVMRPLELTGLLKKVDVAVLVRGGGIPAQAQAVGLGISRALLLLDPNQRLVLKKEGLLRRDARKKERKKPGLKRARRAPQWQKR